MLKENQSRKNYPSDLTDTQWTRVEPLLPPAKSRQRGGRPRQVELREVLNTIRYLVWSNNINAPILNRLQVIHGLLLALHSPLL